MHTGSVNNLVESPPAWLTNRGGEFIAVSSRVRLARNVEGIPFPARCTPELRTCIFDRICSEAGRLSWLAHGEKLDICEVGGPGRDILVECRLASRELSSGGTGSGLVYSRDRCTSLMINEEDHLRMQTVLPGLALGEAWRQVAQVDSDLSERLPYTFDETWGYLTSCPTNLGTGLRASVMLHLPGLGIAEMMEPVVHGIQTLGFEVRGALGEGTEAVANLFQISNRSTLGESETDIIRRLEALIRQVIRHEQNARVRLTGKYRQVLYDTVGRAYGVLRHAYTLTTREALNGLSALRLGVDLGMFSSLRAETIDRLMLNVQPGHLQWQAGGELPPEQRDEYRAGLTRAALSETESPPFPGDSGDPETNE